MKVFISADIEGITGIVDWDEANPGKKEITYFREQMTREVAAACEGANQAGAQTITIRDAHATARNIDARKLPRNVELLRGWTGHPYMMVDTLDASYKAVILIGYHSRVGSDGNPLAHTMSSSLIGGFLLNGKPASEALINTFTATDLSVPVVLVSGDEALCREISDYNESIALVATNRGIGAGSVSKHPDLVVDSIREATGKALRGLDPARMKPLPSSFDMVIEFRKPDVAFRKSFYPGAKLVDARTLRYESEIWFDMLRFLHFMIW